MTSKLLVVMLLAFSNQAVAQVDSLEILKRQVAERDSIISWQRQIILSNRCGDVSVAIAPHEQRKLSKSELITLLAAAAVGFVVHEILGR